MTVYGILSDIHGNLEALNEAVAAMRGYGVEQFLCLGDIVGYNAESNECVSAVVSLGMNAIAGNHDLIAIGKLGFERCAPAPAFALRRTRRDLTDKSRGILVTLPGTRVFDEDLLAIHGSIEDVCRYLETPADVEENHGLLAKRHPGTRVCFFGHTHDQRLYEVHKGVAAEHVLVLGARIDLSTSGRTFFVNPGSIDASRRGESNVAQFAVFNSVQRTLTMCGVPYDRTRVEARSSARGYRMNAVDQRIHGAVSLARRVKRVALARLKSALGGVASEESP